jgi:hypothetical protein
MNARLHNIRVAVWGEAAETPEERKASGLQLNLECYAKTGIAVEKD